LTTSSSESTPARSASASERCSSVSSVPSNSDE
jgi:hypothetical protein